jgi:hypothetical protein
MTSELPCGPVGSIAEAVEQMTAIDAGLPASDGVGAFNHMYLIVTSAVGDAVRHGFFANSAFLDRLDVVFANHYFSALDRAQRGGGVPHCWDVLWRRRQHADVAPLQFAFAGMNAHINRDLPVALVATCEELGVELRSGSPQYKDFELVNGLLARVEARVKRSYLVGPVAVIDRVLHRFDRIDDVLAMWEVRRAREAAWTNAETLWALRADSSLRAEFIRVLDRAVGFAGRGLLVPADTFLRKVARALQR